MRVQWQAQEPPQAAAAAVPPLSLEDEEDDAAPSLLAATGVSAGLPPPPRKSVAYQPEPFSWKPAAVTCFENDSAPQAGQVDSGASESFCSTSFACPQLLQR